MFQDVEAAIARRNKILFSRKSACLEEFRLLFAGQSHLAIVLWAFDCVRFPMNDLGLRHRDRAEVRAAYDLSFAWAHGEVKMPVARKAILACHALAKEADDARDVALYHAVGQACSAVHVETHGLGLPFYELTAIVLACGCSGYEQAVLDRIDYYTQSLLYWSDRAPELAQTETWAPFLLRQGAPNREKLLLERERASR